MGQLWILTPLDVLRPLCHGSQRQFLGLIDFSKAFCTLPEDQIVFFTYQIFQISRVLVPYGLRVKSKRQRCETPIIKQSDRNLFCGWMEKGRTMNKLFIPFLFGDCDLTSALVFAARWRGRVASTSHRTSERISED